MYLYDGSPLKNGKLAELKELLSGAGLHYDGAIDHTVALYRDDGYLIGSGSLDKNVLKCICIREAYNGEGLLAQIITALVSAAVHRGQTHLLLFTKPKNRAVFSDFGFYPILQTDEILFMENTKDGFQSYVRTLSAQTPPVKGRIGAVVANCNPFTRGHRYLVERAAADCALVHLFILSADLSEFPADVRWRLVVEGVRDLPNVVVHPTSEYLVSAATFPTYFIKDCQRADRAACALDLQIFAKCVAPQLHITARYVGTEPLSPVTDAYNQAMKEILPRHGIEVCEIPRLEMSGAPISASRVRTLLREGSLVSLGELIPETTLNFLQSEAGVELIKRLNDGCPKSPA